MIPDKLTEDNIDYVHGTEFSEIEIKREIIKRYNEWAELKEDALKMRDIRKAIGDKYYQESLIEDSQKLNKLLKKIDDRIAEYINSGDYELEAFAKGLQSLKEET